MQEGREVKSTSWKFNIEKNKSMSFDMLYTRKD